MNRLPPALALAALTALGCTDAPTAPQSTPPPRFAFSDGARSGNPDFFFLFPLGHRPRLSANWDVGKAKTDKNTRIEICRLTTGSNPQCEATIKEFSPDQITVVNPGAFLSDESNEYEFPKLEPFYRAVWWTHQSNLVADRFYRISVFIGQELLGFVDIDPVRTLSQLLNVDRTKYIGAIAGFPLPIRYRVEDGALCDVNTTCVEQHVTKEQGALVRDDPANTTVYIDIPPDALPVDATIKIERKAVPPSGICESTSLVPLQFEGCFVIESFPDIGEFGGFLKDVIVAFCVDRDVPQRLRANLEMIKWDNGVAKRLRDAPAPFLGLCEEFSKTPPPEGGVIGWADRELRALASRVGRFTRPRVLYASDGGLGGILDGARDGRAGDALSTFFWGVPAAAVPMSAVTQTGVVGQPVGIPPTIRVETAHEHEHDGGEEAPHFHEPLSDVSVTFTVTGGGGKLLNAAGAEDADGAVEVLSDDGEATLPSGWTWVLGDEPGTNTIEATGAFAGSPVEFSVTAVPETIGLTFETYPGGGATCVSCTVTDEYVSQGVVFAFTPANPDVTAAGPQLILAGNYDPVGSGANHSVTTAAIPGTGFFIAGTVSLYFPHAPGSVQFRLRGNNDHLNPFPVSAYSGPGSPLSASQITRSGVSTFTPGFASYLGREEIVTLTSPDGIARVDLPMTGSIGGTLIDNLLIGEVPSGVINFETDPSGEPICADGCDLTTAFEGQGVTFSFQSFLDDNREPLTPKTNASICDGSRIDPSGFGAVNHVVTGPMTYPCDGGFGGMLTMTFGSATTEVRFALRQRDQCTTAWNATGADDGDPLLSAGDVFHYTFGEGSTGEQLYHRATHPGGIATINVFIQQDCDAYLDNLVIIRDQ